MIGSRSLAWRGSAIDLNALCALARNFFAPWRLCVENRQRGKAAGSVIIPTVPLWFSIVSLNS
jgi:hypothetical protein